MQANIVAKILAALILLLPLGGMARTWTDDEIGQLLIAMTVQRDEASVNQLIAFGQDGPQAELLQRFLWQKFAEVGPSTAVDNYAKSVLDNPDSPPGMKFGALSYFSYSPEEWMREYALRAVDESQNSEVRAIGFYLAALLGITEQRTATVAFVDGHRGSEAAYALLAMAEWQSVEYIYDRYGATHDQNALVTALDLAKFLRLTNAEKRERGYLWLSSGDNDLAFCIFQKALQGNHADWLMEWHIASISVSAGGVASLTYAEKWMESYLRTLGYRLIPVAAPGSAEPSIAIQKLNRGAF